MSEEFPKHFYMRIDIEQFAWEAEPQEFVKRLQEAIEGTGRDLFNHIVRERAK